MKVAAVDLDAARPALSIHAVGAIVRVDTGVGAGFCLVCSGAHAAHLGGDEIVSVECTALMLVGEIVVAAIAIGVGGAIGLVFAEATATPAAELPRHELGCIVVTASNVLVESWVKLALVSKRIVARLIKTDELFFHF